MECLDDTRDDTATCERTVPDPNASPTAPPCKTKNRRRWGETAFWLAAVLITAVAAFIAGRW